MSTVTWSTKACSCSDRLSRLSSPWARTGTDRHRAVRHTSATITGLFFIKNLLRLRNSICDNP